MQIHHLGAENTVLNQFTSELRSAKIQKDRLRFRRNVERIGEIMAYEISKTFDYSAKEVETPLGIANCSTPDNNVVLSTILRAGLPLHRGFLNFYDNAENAFVSAYRKYVSETDFKIHIEYIASPRIDNKTLIIVDPMLATGGSMELAYQALMTKGKPAHLHMAAIISSREALRHLERRMPDKAELWVATIDEEMNDHYYIVPGLGDAGDLAYGEK
ncbi:MAG: uracil phosphoribosyltransferase [Massilibacteroides sp.]|nr:uracil phosphoribosyltransferase [Massilibacteroides sp.]